MSDLTAQDEIIAVLKTIPNGPGKFLAVYEGGMTEERMAEVIGNTVEPFIIVDFTGFTQSPKRMKHMVGAANDLFEMGTVVDAIGSSKRDVNRVIHEVRKRLIGFQPARAGELQPALFHSTGEFSVLGSPVRTSATQTFVGYVGLD